MIIILTGIMGHQCNQIVRLVLSKTLVYTNTTINHLNSYDLYLYSFAQWLVEENLATQTNQSQIGSMAIWCEVKKDQKASMEAHFNLWRIAGHKSHLQYISKDFIEIGLLVKNTKYINKIHLYLPIDINYSLIKDVSSYLKKPSIAQGIFNENLQCLTGRHINRFKLMKEENLFCWVHEFMKDDEYIDKKHLSLNKKNCGTILTIESDALKSLESMGNDEKVYFRLRIYLPTESFNPFINVLTPYDHNFLSGFDEIEYIDFRFNEVRTLPENIETLIRHSQQNGIVKITLLAFLTAFPINSDLYSCSTPWHKTRLLEHDLWSSYVPSGIPKGMVVYHWKKEIDEKKKAEKKFGISDFTSLVKTRTRRSGLRTLLIYLFIFFFVGFLGSLASSYIYPKITSINLGDISR